MVSSRSRVPCLVSAWFHVFPEPRAKSFLVSVVFAMAHVSGTFSGLPHRRWFPWRTCIVTLWPPARQSQSQPKTMPTPPQIGIITQPSDHQSGMHVKMEMHVFVYHLMLIPLWKTACGKQKWDETRQDEDVKRELNNKTRTSKRLIMQLPRPPNFQC